MCTRRNESRTGKPLDPFDPTGGKKLLESHGWHEVDGVMNKAGKKLAFTMIYSAGDVAATEQVELVKQDWAEEGIDVTLKPEPFSVLLGLMAKPNGYQAARDQGIIYGGSCPSGGALLGFQDGQPGGLDTMDWNNPTENALIQGTHEPWPNQAINLRHSLAYGDFKAKELVNLWMPNTDDLNKIAPTVNVPIWSLNDTTGAPLMQYWTVKG